MDGPSVRPSGPRFRVGELLALVVPAALVCRWPALLALAIPGLALYLTFKTRPAGPPLVWHRVVLPAAWACGFVVSLRHPGDEYGLFLVGALPSIWALPNMDGRSLDDVEPFLLAGGVTGLFLAGWALDRLRVSRTVWTIAVALVAGGLVWHALNQYPTYQRAMSKNGSLTAYVSSAMNIGLYLVSLAALVFTPLWRLLLGRRRSSPAASAVGKPPDGGE